jgi:hypothetical protein
MNDTPETPQATTPPTTPQSEAKKKITRSIINQKHVKTLDKTNLVLTAAQKPGYAALLAGSEIDGPFVDQLTTDTAACSTRIANALDLTTGIRTATKAEAKARADLHAASNGVRAAAKQKYAHNGTPAAMKDYHVGEDIASSRAMQTQAADNMLTALKTDTLPGITPAKQADLKAKRDAYFTANAAQAGVQSQATSERTGIETDVKSIVARRAQIQFAADGIWPAEDKANAPIRREFKLPPYRPLSR